MVSMSKSMSKEMGMPMPMVERASTWPLWGRRVCSREILDIPSNRVETHPEEQRESAISVSVSDSLSGFFSRFH